MRLIPWLLPPKRPTGTDRDYQAERIRWVLRRAWCREWLHEGDRWFRLPGRAGFVVEGGRGDSPFLVGCPGDGRFNVDLELARMVRALVRAGYRVTVAHDDGPPRLKVQLPRKGLPDDRRERTEVLMRHGRRGRRGVFDVRGSST